MKLKILVFSVIVTTSFVSVAAEKLPAGHPNTNAANSTQQAASAQLPQQGKVTEIINVPQYTYLQVTQGNAARWIAAPSVDVKKGDNVRFDNGLEMKDFHSNSLDRSFPSILFVNQVVVSK